MKLKKLIKKLPLTVVKGSQNCEITGICSNSKRVVPGNLFVARKGTNDHGGQYVVEAVRTGAAAILTDMVDPFLEGVAQMIHPHPEQLEAELAREFYGDISKEMTLVGITGTNGKTTCAYLLHYLLMALKMKTGVVGTVEWNTGGQIYPSTNTTPDIHTMYKLLTEMRKNKCKGAVLEVSSHALDQGRCDTLDFNLAIFTNLSREHLDYHTSMDEYLEAKLKLFKAVGNEKKKIAKSVVNIDSPYAEKVIEASTVPVITYGVSSTADVRGTNIEPEEAVTKLTVDYNGENVHFNVPLVGDFNVLNVLAVTAACLSLGYSLGEIGDELATFPGVPGRLEKVPNLAGKKIYVDYAHTPDALENVLKAIPKPTDGKLVLVFGCGGDRDRQKRPRMAQVAEKYADAIYVTSDNPRFEDPEAIIDQVMEGFDAKEKVYRLKNRKEAIEKAVQISGSSDIILIAGKGHEKTQIIGRQELPFDDVLVARGAIKNALPI